MNGLNVTDLGHGVEAKEQDREQMKNLFID